MSDLLENNSELAYLRERGALLNEALASQSVLEIEMRSLKDFIYTIFDAVPHVHFVYDVEPNQVFRASAMNPFAAAISGISVEQWIGKTPEEILSPDEAEFILARLNECIVTGNPVEYDQRFDFPSGEIWAFHVLSPIKNVQGAIIKIVGTAFDITQRKRQELANKATQEKQAIMLAQQAETLLELSTPLLMIDMNIAIMPLIGTIDSRRAMNIMERMLTGIAARSIQVVIIDITAILMVDTQVADALIRASHAAKLLGATVILTGIQPEVAQMMIELGVDLQGILTRSSLQSGIQTALTTRTSAR